MADALSAIRVLEMSEAMAGPYCSMILGDLGADVIKVERPRVGDQSRQWAPPALQGESVYFLSVNRNKRSLTLDIKSAAGQNILHRLVKIADVFITNVPRLESLRRANLDPDTLRALNPRLVFAAISGYGHSGPKAGRGGYDVVAQGEAGLMALTGGPQDGPVRFPTPIADISAGAYAAMSILAALYVRERTGQGQFVDVSLLNSQVTWLANIGANVLATGQRPPKFGSQHPSITPYQPVRCKDKMIIIAVGTEALWQRFCRVLGSDGALLDNPLYATNPLRNQHRTELIAHIERILAERSAAEWLDLFAANEIPAGPINFPDEALADPHLQARGMIVELEHPLAGLVRSIGSPLHLSDTPPTYRRYPPRLGEHSNEILQGLGCSAAEIAEMREKGVV